MQPIERYGLIALLFLVVTVVAVVLWDRGERRTDGALAKDLTAAAQEAAAKDTAERTPTRTGSRVTPESTRGQPPASATPRGGLVRLPTENVAPPTGTVAAPTTTEAAVASHGGVAQALEAQRATLASIAGLRDPVQQEVALRAELQKYPEHHGLLMQMFREEVAAATDAPPAVRVIGEDPRARAPITVAATQPAGMGLAPMTVDPAAKSQRTYTVRAGDTLGEISQRELGTARRFGEILALNPGLDERRLVVGRTLVLPPATTTEVATSAPAPTTAAARPAATAPESGAFHVVRAGESLYSIAAKTLGDGKRHREIAALNPNVDPSRLLVGQRLRLPEAKSAPQATPATQVAAAAPPAARETAATQKPSGGSRVR